MAAIEATIERTKRPGPGRRRYRYRPDVWIRPISLYRASQLTEGTEVALTIFSRVQWQIRGIVIRNAVNKYKGGIFFQGLDGNPYFLPSRYFTHLKVWETWEWQ